MSHVYSTDILLSNTTSCCFTGSIITHLCQFPKIMTHFSLSYPIPHVNRSIYFGSILWLMVYANINMALALLAEHHRSICGLPEAPIGSGKK